MLTQVLNTINTVIDTGFFSQEDFDILANSEKRLEVSFPVKMDDGSIKLFTGYRVQHSTILGPALGSISILPDSCIDECEGLAMLMSLNNAVLGNAMGGSKGIIIADISKLSTEEIERLYKGYIYAILDILGKKKDVIKLQDFPDNFSYQIIDQIDKLLDIKSVVNRPKDYFGTGLDRKAQSYSIVICLKKVLSTYCAKNIEEVKLGITIDEDNIDTDLLLELHRMGLKIEGFNVDNKDNICSSKIWEFIREHKWDFNHSFLTRDCNPYPEKEDYKILTADVDVLVLQSPKFRITADIAEDVKAKYVIEADENLISSEAEVILEDRGIVIIPDFISLSGLLINAYIEWSAGTESCFLSIGDCYRMMHLVITNSLDRIWEAKKKYNTSTRIASLITGIQRILSFKKKKGALI